MLKHLSKQKDNKQYVTRDELKSLIKAIREKGNIKGDKGNDAYVTDDIIQGILREATPTDEVLKGIIAPLIPAPLKGEPGDKGKNGDELSAEVLMDKLKSIKGDGRLLIDHIRGGKRIIGKLGELDGSLRQLNNNFVYLNEQSEELFKFKTKVEGLEILVNGGGSDNHLESQALNAMSLDSTLTDGTVISTDLSSIAGGGGVYTFSNGLTNTAGNVILGGALSADTIVNGVGGTWSMQFGNLRNGGFLTNTGNEVYVTQTSAYILSNDHSVLANATGIEVTTPAVVATTATVGQVLKLVNATTGEVEFATEGTVSSLPATAITYNNATSGLTAIEVQAAIDELVTLIPSVIVSTDADNSITVGTDGGAYLDETIATVASADGSVDVNAVGSDYDLSVDAGNIDFTTVTDWNSFVTSLTTNWTATNWNDFTATFFSELSTTEIDTFINLWDSTNIDTLISIWNAGNFGTFIDSWVANTSATDWNTFIDAFMTNVDSDDVTNFLDQLTATKGDILVSDGTNWQQLAIGTDGQQLEVDSGEATGIKWGAAGTGGTSITLTANEDLVAGQTVGIASTLENQAMQAVLSLRSQATATIPGTSSGVTASTVCEISPNKYVVPIKESDSPYSDQRVFVLELDEDTMTFTFGAVSPIISKMGISSIAKIDTDKFIITTVQATNSSNLVSVACSVSGLTVSIIDSIQVSCIDYDSIKSVQMATDRAAVVVSKSTPGGTETSDIVEVLLSGTTISYSTFKQIVVAQSSFGMAKVDTDKVALLCGSSSSATFANTITIATVSGGVWTIGTPLKMSPLLSGTQSDMGIFSSVNNEVYVTGFIGAVTTNRALLKYTTTTMTPVLAASGLFTSSSSFIVSDGSDIYLVGGSFYKVSESGSVLTMNKVSGQLGIPLTSNQVLSSAGGYFLIIKGAPPTSGSPNSTSNIDYHVQGMTSLYTGIAQNTVSRGGDVIVKISGIDGNQTGLIPGATYEPSAGGLIPSTGLTPYTLQATSDTTINI